MQEFLSVFLAFSERIAHKIYLNNLNSTHIFRSDFLPMKCDFYHRVGWVLHKCAHSINFNAANRKCSNMLPLYKWSVGPHNWNDLRFSNDNVLMHTIFVIPTSMEQKIAIDFYDYLLAYVYVIQLATEWLSPWINSKCCNIEKRKG